jgi:hypothetical protein
MQTRHPKTFVTGTGDEAENFLEGLNRHQLGVVDQTVINQAEGAAQIAIIDDVRSYIPNQWRRAELRLEDLSFTSLQKIVRSANTSPQCDSSGMINLRQVTGESMPAVTHAGSQQILPEPVRYRGTD